MMERVGTFWTEDATDTKDDTGVCCHSGATDLGFTRDRRFSVPKSAKADLGAKPTNPESILTDSGYGFRARRFAAPRNDGESGALTGRDYRAFYPAIASVPISKFANPRGTI